ncbi:MAG: MBL fold metallo-hydrolase [Bacilli bacterium]|nr:MBL fold metallo-hydrolase [Bacilli bacterium]
MNIHKIVVGNLDTNCYLIIKNQKCLIVDPGDDFNKIKNEIEKLNVKPICVLITHHHFDHIGTLNDILNYYNIELIDFNNYKTDDEIITIDEFKFKMIYVPGHKSDLITYYFENEKVMFVGDFIFKNNIGRWDLKTGNKDEMLNSIKKIKKYPNDITIYPGHGENTNLGYEIKNNIYFNEMI